MVQGSGFRVQGTCSTVWFTLLFTVVTAGFAQPTPDPGPITHEPSSFAKASEDTLTINPSASNPPPATSHLSPPTSSSARLPPATELMQGLMKRLPSQSILLTGDLITTSPDTHDAARLGTGILLCYPTLAQYTIMDAFGRDREQLTIRRDGGGATLSYQAGNPPTNAPAPALGTPIAGTALTWMDLTLSFLWWPDGKTIGIAEVRGQPCYVVDAHAPAGQTAPYASVRMWVDTRASMMLQAEGYDTLGEPIRRISVKSFKKINDEWMIKDLEIGELKIDRRTILRIRDAETVANDKAP